VRGGYGKKLTHSSEKIGKDELRWGGRHVSEKGGKEAYRGKKKGW